MCMRKYDEEKDRQIQEQLRKELLNKYGYPTGDESKDKVILDLVEASIRGPIFGIN